MKKYPFVYVYLPMFSLAVIILTAYFIYETKFAVKTEKLYGTWELISAEPQFPFGVYAGSVQIEFSQDRKGRMSFRVLNGLVNQSIYFSWLPSTQSRYISLRIESGMFENEDGYFEYDFSDNFSKLELSNSAYVLVYRKVF